MTITALRRQQQDQTNRTVRLTVAARRRNRDNPAAFNLTEVFGPPTDADLAQALEEMNVLFRSTPANERNKLIAALRSHLVAKPARRTVGQALTRMLRAQCGPQTRIKPAA